MASWSRYSGAAPSPVLTAAVTGGDAEDYNTALGNLHPREYVDGGTQVSGQVKQLYYQIGDNVPTGGLLDKIDPAMDIVRVEADRGQLLNLKAQLADHADAVTAQIQKTDTTLKGMRPSWAHRPSSASPSSRP